MKSKTLLLTLFAILCCCPVVSAFPDTIEVNNGRTLRGEITAMTADSVTINSSKTPVPIENIKRLSYDGEPNGLRNARRNVLDGRNNRILEELGSITETVSDEKIKLDILFYQAFAESKLALSGEQGTVRQAAVSMGSFLKASGAQDNYHYYEAVEIFGDLALSLEKFEIAAKEYQKITKSKSKPAVMRGYLKVAEAQVAQGDFKGAVQSYGAAESVDLNTVEAIRSKLLAGIGKAACNGELGESDKGIEYLRDLIKKEDSSDSELFGKAYNALGKCYLKSGLDKEAIYAY